MRGGRHRGHRLLPHGHRSSWFAWCRSLVRSFVRRFRSRFHSSASVRSLPFARVDRVVAACRRRGSSSPSTRKRRGDRGARNLSGDSRETGINGQLHKYNVWRHFNDARDTCDWLLIASVCYPDRRCWSGQGREEGGVADEDGVAWRRGVACQEEVREVTRDGRE